MSFLNNILNRKANNSTTLPKPVKGNPGFASSPLPQDISNLLTRGSSPTNNNLFRQNSIYEIERDAGISNPYLTRKETGLVGAQIPRPIVTNSPIYGGSNNTNTSNPWGTGSSAGTSGLRNGSTTPTGTGTSPWGTQTTPTTPTQPVNNTPPGTPVVGNQMQNAQNVLNAGAASPQELALLQEQQRAQNAYAPFLASTYASPGTRTMQDFGNEYKKSLYNAELQGLEQRQKGIQNITGRALTSAQEVLSAGQPQAYSPTNVPYNPLTGQYGSPSAGAYGAGGLAGVGGLLQQQQQGADTQMMIGAYNQARPLIETAKQQIQATNFNASPIALANQLQQYVNRNIIPSGEYANIFNTLSEIATTISPVLGAQGAQTDLKTMISQQFIPQLMQGKDLSTVFDNIEENALAKIEANKMTAMQQPLTTPSGSYSGGSGGFAENWLQP